MLFTFWTVFSLAVPDSVQAWCKRFPDFVTFKDEDVLPLLDSDHYRDLYKRISIPACKADIARLALLREHGGVYVDLHTGPSDGDALAETIEDLARFDLLLFGKGWEGSFNFMNSILIARRQAPVLQLILDGAFTNLINHERREANSTEHIPYHVLI